MNTSKSATNSPIIAQKRLLSPSSLSVSSSPRITRSNRYAQRILENEKIQEEARKLLMNGQQKLIIIPASKSGVNGKSSPQVKVCTNFTTSSDSSEGKRTPPRNKHNSMHTCHKMFSKNCTGRSPLQNLRTPQNFPSLRSLKTTNLEEKPSQMLLPAAPSLGSFISSDVPVTLRPLSDDVSVRSLVSISMGSTDGKKLVIRRVPTSPSDFFNFSQTSP